MPKLYKKPYRPYKRKYRKRNNPKKKPVRKLMRIPRSIANRQAGAVSMNLVHDFQVYVDPSNGSGNVQKGIVITFCANSLYPFLSGSSQTYLQKTTGAKVNFEDPIEAYNVDAPNPATATIAPGVYNQGEYSQGRKYERAYISGAKLTVWTTTTQFSAQDMNTQAGLLTLMTHNRKVSPFSVDTNNGDLKLLSPRVTRRIEPSTNAQYIPNSKIKQTQMSVGLSVAKLNHIKDIQDDLENYGFDLDPTGAGTGSTSTANVPLEKSYISLNYMPCLQSSMTGVPTQAPPVVMRMRLQQRITLVEQRSHSQTPGVNWNLPKPFTAGAGITSAFIAGALAGY